MPIDITPFALFGILLVACVFDHIKERRNRK